MTDVDDAPLTRGGKRLPQRILGTKRGIDTCRLEGQEDAVFVAADETNVPYPTDDLLDRYAPGVPRLRSFPGREVPIDLTRARTLLGFRAEHLLPVEPAPLPPA